jgi:TRAP-type C4-dicarboxylate transport system permease small subunit
MVKWMTKTVIRKESATLSIAALSMAIAYLLLVAAGAMGALLVLLWLFREDMPGTTEDIERDKFEVSRSAEHLGSKGTHSIPVEPECWEDEAA